MPQTRHLPTRNAGNGWSDGASGVFGNRLQLLRRWCGPAQAQEWDPLTLRFRERSVEDLFLRSRGKELTSRLLVAAGAVILFCFETLLVENCINGACHVTAENVTGGIRSVADGHGTTRRQQQAVIGAGLCLASMAVIAKTCRLFERIPPAACELGAVCMVLGIAMAVTYVPPQCIANLHIYELLLNLPKPRAGDRRSQLQPISGLSAVSLEIFEDLIVLFTIIVVIFFSHLMLPIRWCVLWPVDCVSAFVYVVVAAQGGQENSQRVSRHLGVVAVLGLGALAGVRRAEFHERCAFLHSGCGGSRRPSVSPKHSVASRHPSGTTDEDLREEDEEEEDEDDIGAAGVQADFAEEYWRDDDVDDGMSLPSVSTTTVTGRCFQELEREPRWKLERIADIGLKERWLIQASEMRVFPDKILGSGSFGVVVKATLHGSFVAVKVPKSPVVGATAWHLPSIGNELRILRHIRHPNIVLFHGACVDPASSELALVLEFVHGRPLDRFMESMPSSASRHSVLVDICCALRYLHAQRPSVVHGDLKATNILVEESREKPCPKLVDFGLSRLLTRTAKPLGGTLSWMAPEIIQTRGMAPAPSADVFSFGRLTYFMITGLEPSVGVDTRNLLKLARAGRQPPLEWPDGVPFLEEGRTLVARCSAADAWERPTMSGVYQDLIQWVTIIDGVAAEGRLGDGESLSWSDGLKAARDLLRRPQPPPRPSRSAGVEASADKSFEGATGAAARDSLDDFGGSMETTDCSKRSTRPLPPSRAVPQCRLQRQVLPTLPPLLETVVAPESTMNLSKSVSVPGDLSSLGRFSPEPALSPMTFVDEPSR